MYVLAQQRDWHGRKKGRIDIFKLVGGKAGHDKQATKKDRSNSKPEKAKTKRQIACYQRSIWYKNCNVPRHQKPIRPI